MYWNYRLLRTERKRRTDKEVTLTLVEAYYEDGQTVPHSYAEPHAISGDSHDDVDRLLILARTATEKPPIMLTDDDKVVEWHERANLKVVKPEE